MVAIVNAGRNSIVIVIAAALGQVTHTQYSWEAGLKHSTQHHNGNLRKWTASDRKLTAKARLWTANAHHTGPSALQLPELAWACRQAVRSMLPITSAPITTPTHCPPHHESACKLD